LDKKHIAIDLETLGNGTNAVVVAIGACAFDAKHMTPFYTHITAQSAVEAGLVMDASTVMWWLSQSDEARAALTRDDGVPLTTALEDFAEWLSVYNVQGVWGNGIAFDNVILRNAYKAIGMLPPWQFRADRDMRTLVWEHQELFDEDPREVVDKVGTDHNALDDALFQADVVRYSLIKKGINLEYTDHCN
jgi:hypothetical protein